MRVVCVMCVVQNVGRKKKLTMKKKMAQRTEILSAAGSDFPLAEIMPTPG